MSLMADAASETCCPTRRRVWTDPWRWVPISATLVGTAGWWWPSAAGVSRVYLENLRMIAPPFAFGLLLGGVVDHLVPKAFIVRWLSGPRKRVITRATLLGMLASSCSHGCLALALELYRKGASVPAVISFLLASPWASLPLTVMLVSLFGLNGVAIVVVAMVIAWVTGVVFQQLARRGWIESNPHTGAVETERPESADLIAHWRGYRWSRRQAGQDVRAILRATVPLGRMVLGWVQAGLILSAVVGALLPQHAMMRYLGPSAGGLLSTLALATVLEVCSEGTAPLAFELYRHTGALGNAFALLMAGVVTDYTELGALWTTVGRRTVGWLLAVALPLVLLAGWALNQWR